jgi:hypothetical protein
MKPVALFTVALLSWEAASLTLPVREQDSAATDIVLLDIVDDGSSYKHLETRGEEWVNWAPSAKCVRHLCPLYPTGMLTILIGRVHK